MCLKCERCLHACRANAIYFEHGIRKIDYTKCVACLSCHIVCPRNAIQVTSIDQPEQIVSIKIDHEKCSMCEECTNQDGKFCPQNLFYLDSVKKTDQEDVGIRFKFKEIGKCQGCLKCEKLCPEKAIIPIILNST